MMVHIPWRERPRYVAKTAHIMKRLSFMVIRFFRFVRYLIVPY